LAREKVWIVREGDGRTLVEILRRAGEQHSAIDDGRVFVGRKRATRDQPVRAGDTVRIGPPQARFDPQILFEGRGLVACVKPAGLPTVPDHGGAAHSLVASVAAKIGRKAGDLRVTSRLDREVSGVVIFALDAEAEERLKTARAEGHYRRRYVALASGELAESGVWDAPIGRATDPRLRKADGVDAKASTTTWQRIAQASGVAMLAVDPMTGRTHQIRVHASHAGAPLVGDRDYGGPNRIVRANGAIVSVARIALHAAKVTVPDLACEAAIPEELEGIWAALGGEKSAWAEAVTR
jgi:RluA family pseudouridine synthase